MSQHYDLIGDIHGYATPLKSLLEKLGFRNPSGVYRNPERKVIFLGDFIDRGPEIRETLHIVRAMVDGGSALAVMGNHEFNALAYHTPDGGGSYLRPHTEKNNDQHQATLAQLVVPHPEEWKGWLDWFARLPLFLDFGDLRAVHAAWNPRAVDTFREIKRIDHGTLRDMTRKGSLLYKLREDLLNGVEIDLPKGHYFSDGSNVKRNRMRIRWWESPTGKTYRQMVFPASETVPSAPILNFSTETDLTYAPVEPPVFFGHYWVSPTEAKAPQARNVACLDYSVARGGFLTAYRWEGESNLLPEKFVTVGNSLWKLPDQSN